MRWLTTSNCIGPTAASTGERRVRRSEWSSWITPSWSSWAIPRWNCLWRDRSTARAARKCSGANGGMRGNSILAPLYRVSPERSSPALTSPMMSPGYATSMVSRSRPNTLCTYFVVNARPVGSCVTTSPRRNTPEQTLAKARRSR